VKAGYGDVLGEQRAMLEEAAVVEGGFDLVWVEGPDAVRFLDGLLSQDLAAMQPGDVARSLFLQPQGKLRHLLWVLAGAERVGLLVDDGRGDTLAADLRHYRIRVKADIRVDDRPVVVVWGPRARQVTGAGGGWAEADGRVLVPLAGAVERVAVIGEWAFEDVPMAGRLAVTAVRVAAGEPVMDVDVDESTIPQESGLVSESVSFTKGCYLGQELVARIDSRGHVNRRLCGLVITRNVLPPDGAAVWAGDREVGAITSVSDSLEIRAPIGLALIRREVEEGEEVEIRWETGSVAAIVRSVPMHGS
jgi:folate-binding protein YgfZ